MKGGIHIISLPQGDAAKKIVRGESRRVALSRRRWAECILGGFMRNLKKNQQPLYYSTYSDEIKIYQRDEDGNIVYIEVDGEQIPVEIGTVAGYNKPVSFYANIAMSGGEAEAKEYGFDSSAYEAVLVTTDKSLPISETSRIWHTSRPQYNDDGTVNGDSADYSVLAVKPSLNAVKYLLKKLPKGRE